MEAIADEELRVVPPAVSAHAVDDAASGVAPVPHAGVPVHATVARELLVAAPEETRDNLRVKCYNS